MGINTKIHRYEKRQELAHRLRVSRNEKEMMRIIDKAILDIAKQISILQAKNIKEPAKFIYAIKRNKILQRQLKDMQVQLHRTLNTVANTQIEKEFVFANIKNDAIYYMYAGEKITTKVNIDALQSFINRKIKGINLSDRLWNVSKSTQNIIEDYIASGISQGKSTVNIVKDLQGRFGSSSLLNSPRVKGQYKNSRKALQRIVRTEVNSAFRGSDIARMRETSFIIGYRVSLSFNHPRADVCDSLAGVYPKTFSFLGWHSNCFCVLTTILQSRADFKNKLKPSNIKTVPIGCERLAKTYGKDKLRNSLWIKDNFSSNMNLKKSVGKARKNIEPYKIKIKL